ncbi:MAG: hypothetical protein IPK16_14245 [Anaerolineales bacterium]|nr:hypothetical protein [Anaerolineales bacterium]
MDRRPGKRQVFCAGYSALTVVERLAEELHVDLSPEALKALPPLAAPVPIPEWAKEEAALAGIALA